MLTPSVLHPNGKMGTQPEIELRTKSLPALAPRQDLDKHWTLPTTFEFIAEKEQGARALKFLNSPGNGGKRLVFTLSAKHGLSGTEVVQRVSYKTTNVKWGSSLEG